MAVPAAWTWGQQGYSQKNHRKTDGCRFNQAVPVCFLIRFDCIYLTGCEKAVIMDKKYCDVPFGTGGMIYGPLSQLACCIVVFIGRRLAGSRPHRINCIA